MNFEEVPVDIRGYKAVWHLPPGIDSSSMEYLGGGTFGRVMSVLTDDGAVAIKKFTNPFFDIVYAKRTYREVCLLRHLSRGGCPFVIRYMGTYSPQVEAGILNDIYMVTERCDSDLRTVLMHNELSESHIQLMMYRVLCGLTYIHSAGIVHRDLKPENIAVCEDCTIRIIDMGLGRGRPTAQETPYVQTRAYRAPEVVALCEYDNRADVWSFGCIICECFSRRLPFPGKSTTDQFQTIFSKLGTPPPSFLEQVPTDSVRLYIETLGEKESVPIQSYVPNCSEEALDLLNSILVYVGRPQAHELLEHPFFAPYREEELEIACDPFDASFEEEELSMENLHERVRQLIIEDMGGS
eukprot:m.28969 g.28969  ORF g.28969 m.28969 type:complete len:353 (+) comp6109_c0_seq1:223-1281(+)